MLVLIPRSRYRTAHPTDVPYLFRSRSSPAHRSSNSRSDASNVRAPSACTARSRGPAVSFGLDAARKVTKHGTSFLLGLLKESVLLLFDRQATDRHRFRLCAIRCAPILAGLSAGPTGPCSLRRSRVHLDRNQLRTGCNHHDPTAHSTWTISVCQKGFAWTQAARAAETIGLQTVSSRRSALLCVSGSFGDLAVKQFRFNGRCFSAALRCFSSTSKWLSAKE